jgi:hypothetical protein
MPLISSYPEKTSLVSTDHLLGYQADGSVRVFPGTAFGGGGGTPGGSSGQLQFNSSSAFAGMSGTSWDDTNRSLTISGATVTTSKPVFDLAQTWNAGAVAFTGIKLNITATASAASSMFANYQVGGSSKVSIGAYSANGADPCIWLNQASPDGTNFTLLSFSNNINFNSPGGTLTFSAANNIVAQLINGFARFQPGVGVGWVTSPDTLLFSDAASIVAQRNSTNAQSFRVYSSFTDASNYARMAIVNGNQLKTEKAGTGSDTVTVSTPVLDLAQTWNAGAVTFTGLKLNVTDTASDPASMLMEFQIGAARLLSFQKRSGPETNCPTIYNPNGNICLGARGNGIIFGGHFGGAGADITFSYAGGFRLRSDTFIGFSSTTDAYSSSLDAYLARDAAGILAQRNSTNAQTLRVYNTFTDASNYERAVIDWSITANTFAIGTQAAGTGTARSMTLFAGPNLFQTFNVGTNQIEFAPGGNNTTFGGPIIINGAAALMWSPNDASISRTVAKVVRVGDGGVNANGWMQWAGQARVTSNFSGASSNTTCAAITGLSVNVQAGRTYAFYAYLGFDTTSTAAGARAAIGGTCTATAIMYDGYVLDTNTQKGQANVTSLNTGAATPAIIAASLTTATNAIIEIQGTITVNAAGTLTVMIAQGTSTASSAPVVKRGSYFWVQDMP